MTDLATVRALLDYEPDTGVFRWRSRRQQMPAGSVAGSWTSHGYVVIRVDGVRVRAHHLAWLFVYGEMPEMALDHVNGVRDDNRIVNLRLATRAQNSRNSRKWSGKQEKKGVHKIHDSRFRALIRVDRVLKHIGYFATEQEAHDAYCAAAIKEFGAYHRAG